MVRVNKRNFLKDTTLLALLECPICFETCEPPIYSCINGHNVCQVCILRIEECPLCRDIFAGTRNFTAEQMFDEIQNNNAAPENNNSQNNREGIKCDLSHLNGCGGKVPFADYIDHLKNCHTVFSFYAHRNGTFERRNNVQGRNFIRNGASKMFVLQFEGRVFVIQCHQKLQDVWIWISLHGAENERKNFHGTLKLDGNVQNIPSIEWKGTISNLTKDQWETIRVKNGCSLKTKEGEVRKFIENDGMKLMWRLNVTIKRIPKRPEPIQRQNGVSSTAYRQVSTPALNPVVNPVNHTPALNPVYHTPSRERRRRRCIVM